jgi:hypothetical protein
MLDTDIWNPPLVGNLTQATQAGSDEEGFSVFRYGPHFCLGRELLQSAKPDGRPAGFAGFVAR